MRAFLRRLRCRFFGHSNPPHRVSAYICRHCDTFVRVEKAGR